MAPSSALAPPAPLLLLLFLLLLLPALLLNLFFLVLLLPFDPTYLGQEDLRVLRRPQKFSRARNDWVTLGTSFVDLCGNQGFE